MSKKSAQKFVGNLDVNQVYEATKWPERTPEIKEGISQEAQKLLEDTFNEALKGARKEVIAELNSTGFNYISSPQESAARIRGVLGNSFEGTEVSEDVQAIMKAVKELGMTSGQLKDKIAESLPKFNNKQKVDKEGDPIESGHTVDMRVAKTHELASKLIDAKVRHTLGEVSKDFVDLASNAVSRKLQEEEIVPGKSTADKLVERINKSIDKTIEKHVGKQIA